MDLGEELRVIVIEEEELQPEPNPAEPVAEPERVD